MRILQRYLLRELSASFIGVTLVLCAILLVNQVGTVLARAAELQYPQGVVLELIGLGAVQNVSLVLPFGLLLGIVLAFGRLYHDSEMVAAQSCGVGVWRVAVAVWLLALPVAGLTAWLDFDLGPRAAAAEVAVRAAALRAGMVAPLTPGGFRSFGGRIVVYARSTSRDGTLHNVFVRRGTGPSVQTTTAQRARYSLSADGRTETITLYDGEQLQGIPGSERYRIVRFAQESFPIQLPQITPAAPRIDEIPTARLLHSPTVSLQAELQWRAALPLMALVLTVLAVPLGRLRPRQGRYAAMWSAVLAYALYANLISAARTWLERGRTPAVLGLWWVHALWLLIALAVMAAPWLRRTLRAARPLTPEQPA